jgi:hypothetical protein
VPTALIAAVAAALAALAALPAVAPAEYDEKKARYDQEVGFGDQSVRIFDDPSFQRLAVKRTRLVVPWNVMDQPDELARATAYVRRAQQDEGLVLLHLTDATRGVEAGPLPSRGRYEDALEELVPYFLGLGVREFGVWNEANHRSQPIDKRPERAAEFFIEMYREVHLEQRCRFPRCRIVALDVLDEGDAEEYIDEFYDRLSSTYDDRAETVGVHNYSSVNRFRNKQLSEMITAFRRENRGIDIWITEVGGLVAFGSEKGDFSCDPESESSVRRGEAHQDKAIRWMFRQMRTYRRYLDRLYFYNWFGTDCQYDANRSEPDSTFNLFDAGIVESDGDPRDGYYEFLRKARDYRR